MSKDELTTCPRCGGNACYKQGMGADYTISLCYGCGFTTNSLMKSDSKFLEEQLEVLPELYKDLIYVDTEGYHWIPSTVNLLEKGMVYIDGANTQDWKWSAVKSTTIPEELRENYPIPNKKGEYYEYKMNMKTLKTFGGKEYMDALDYIDMFKIETK